MRGIGWYTARIDHSIADQITGLLLHDASDILSVYWDNLYQGTIVPGGGCTYLPRRAGEVGASSTLIVRAEIWGHSNFDDARLPALRLGAMKGLSGITAVLRERRLGGNWQWHPAGGHGMPVSAMPGVPAPIVAWGRWITNDQPEAGVYLKTIDLSPEADSWVLHFAGLQTLVHVTVNDQPCGVVNPLNPYMDVSHCVQPGQAARVALAIERWHRQPAGDVTLLEGRRATDWHIGGGGEAELWAAAERALPHARHLELPYRLRAGAVGWLFGDVDPLARLGGSWVLRCLGRNAKVTAWFNGQIVGRLWLPGSSRPMLAGGAPDVLQLPEPWLQPANNCLALLVEAVEYGEMAEVSDLLMQPASRST
jgi:beta-galactosidase